MADEKLLPKAISALVSQLVAAGIDKDRAKTIAMAVEMIALAVTHDNLPSRKS